MPVIYCHVIFANLPAAFVDASEVNCCDVVLIVCFWVLLVTILVVVSCWFVVGLVEPCVEEYAVAPSVGVVLLAFNEVSMVCSSVVDAVEGGTVVVLI